MVFLHGNQITSFYGAEVTEGTTPASLAYLVLAHHSTVEISTEDAPVMVKKSGSVDSTSNQVGKRKCMVKINCNPSQSDGLNFLVNYASSDTSLSMEFFNSSKSFLWRVTGCKVKTITPTANKYPQHGPVTFDIELWGWTVLFTESTTPSYGTVPDTFVNWTNVTVKISGSTILTWWSAVFTVTNDLDVQHDTSGTVTAITRGDRELDLTIVKALEDVASQYFGPSQPSFASTSFEIDFVAHTFVFGGAAYKGIPVQLDRTKLAGLQLKIQPATLTIT